MLGSAPMNPLELVWGTAAYLLSSLSLGLASWALAEAALPRPARLGLRLSAILAGQLALCGILVQTLGLLGLLTLPWYLAFSLAPGIAILWLGRGRRPHAAFFRLLQQAFRLFIQAPAGGLGWLGAVFLLYLAKRFFFLPLDIDALTLHGPMIAEWISNGRVSLGSSWNYPQLWEYQFVPSFLLLRSDVLVAIPGLLAVLALVLAVRELAARLALGGRAGHLLAFLVATLPIVWREPLKSDPIFAFALLLGILAVDRAARRRPGSFWLLQLAMFLALGTKATGFFYCGALAGAYLGLRWLRSRGESWGARARTLLPGLGITLLFQASAGAVQLRNFHTNGNPFYPLRFEIFGHLIFAGPGDTSGTSILDNLGRLELWRDLLLKGSRMVGAEWPPLMLLLAVALISALFSARRLLAARKMPGPGQALELILPLVALLLWGLFVATPWSSGLGFGFWQYIGSGASLRYAIAPLALTYLAAAALARRAFGRRALSTALALLFPLLVSAKWTSLGVLGDIAIFLWKLFALWLVVAGLAWALRRWRLAARAGPRARTLAFFLLAWLLAAGFARWAEGIREAVWLPPYRAIWSHIYDQVPSASVIGTNHPVPSFRYFLYGRSFENQIRVFDIGLGESGQIPGDVAYFYVFAPPGRRSQAENRRHGPPRLAAGRHLGRPGMRPSRAAMTPARVDTTWGCPGH